MKRCVALSLALALTLPNAAVANDYTPAPGEPTTETVLLRNDSFVRGEVIERVEGSHVVVRLAGSNKEQRIEWSELQSSQHETTGTAVPGATSSTGPYVHIELGGRGKWEARLEKVTGGTDGSLTTIPVCVAPCDQRIAETSTNDQFVVVYNPKSNTAKSQTTRRFDLAPHRQKVRIELMPRRRRFLVGGAGLIVGSLFVLGAPSSLNTNWMSPGGEKAFSISLWTLGTGMIVSGAVLMILSRSRFKVK